MYKKENKIRREGIKKRRNGGYEALKEKKKKFYYGIVENSVLKMLICRYFLFFVNIVC